MKSAVTLCLFLLSVLTSEAQNYRDEIITKEFIPAMRSTRTMTPENYQRIKGLLEKLDHDYGYEADWHYKLLNWSFYHSDIAHFKSHLEILTEQYGLDASHFSGHEYFYEAIFEGELKAWFKPMYLTKSAIWHDKNFSKLSDIRKLKELIAREEAVSNHLIKVSSDDSFTSEASVALMKIRGEVYFSLLTELYKICRKYDVFPTGKNFGLLHGDFNRLIINNFSTTDNLERTWLLLEPFFKKAYLQNQLDYSFYRSYDIYNYMHFDYQRFGLIERKDVPIVPSEDEDLTQKIPVKNAFETEKVRKEMGWP
ncbi:hypothetical protein [Flavobacterium sp.]|uniref:hypothetical protein n=1 Tax=Flavobacterium sp. TaxID=239 RepID=UPI0028BD9EB2|nr:hypothetical protein [Flavobacterium sp.]